MKRLKVFLYLWLTTATILFAQTVDPESGAQDAAFFGPRCGTAEPQTRALRYGSWEDFVGGQSDCSSSQTNPTAEYDPVILYEIPVVFHIIMTSDCNTGVVTDTQVMEQIEILNEDFLALMGTNGAPGNDTQIRFVLADTDPDGLPTTGITRSCNTTWYNDGGGYYNTLAWDPFRYMNIYTNSADGNLGYVPWLPSDNNGNNVGSLSDRVVLLDETIGRNAPIGPPFHLGRTATHEVGHYLGLEHTFAAGTCSPQPCYTSGDLICDTNQEANPNEGFCNDSQTDCGLSRPIHNYLNYSDDDCMNEFTVEQLRRMRCAMETYRSSLFSVIETCDNLAVALPETDLTCDGGQAQLNALVTGDSGSYTVSWMPTDHLDNPNITNPIATPTETTTYTVTIDDALGCTVTQDVTVSIGPDDGAAFIASWRDRDAYDPTFDIDGDSRISVVDLSWYATGCLPAPLRVSRR